MRGGIRYKKKETIFYVSAIVLYFIALIYLISDLAPKSPW
jgi:hypothetical protein